MSRAFGNQNVFSHFNKLAELVVASWLSRSRPTQASLDLHWGGRLWVPGSCELVGHQLLNFIRNLQTKSVLRPLTQQWFLELFSARFSFEIWFSSGFGKQQNIISHQLFRLSSAPSDGCERKFPFDPQRINRGKSARERSEMFQKRSANNVWHTFSWIFNVVRAKPRQKLERHH